MHSVINQLIRSCNGYVYESAGLINGFFDDPQTARNCALNLRSQVRGQVEVCGCKVSVSLW